MCYNPIGRKKRISKLAFFISNAGKIVRSQLADIQKKASKQSYSSELPSAEE